MRPLTPALLVAVIAATLLAGCPKPAPTRLGFHRDLRLPGDVVVRVEFSTVDAAVIDELSKALRYAFPRASRWGAFTAPVRVRVFPTHGELIEALHRRGLPWLRAWATYDEILLQSPASWGGAYFGRLEELLAHELTHVAIYQIVSSPESWKRVDLPLWFREGMASYTAEQGGWRGDPAAIGAWLLKHPTFDPLASPERLLGTHQDAVYAAAHWAFVRLVEEHGEGAIRSILVEVGDGATFDEAFRLYVGLDAGVFASDWRRSVEALASGVDVGAAGP